MNAFSVLNTLKPKKKPTKRIDISLLKIGNDPFTGRRNTVGKYDELFNKMKPGQSIECEPNEVNPISHAMRKWLEQTGQLDKYIIRISSHAGRDNRGRVWLLPKEDVE